jgi:predicted DNA-binding protein (MmcQ/YjbR family)
MEGELMSEISNVILEFIKKEYGVEPEYLWKNDDTAAIRHIDTKKWFAAYMRNLPKSKFGLDCEEKTDVINLKCEPLLSYSIIDKKGIFPAWHMNKEHWVSVFLDGTVLAEEIYPLIRMSFQLTDKKVSSKKKKSC